MSLAFIIASCGLGLAGLVACCAAFSVRTPTPLPPARMLTPAHRHATVPRTGLAVAGEQLVPGVVLLAAAAVALLVSLQR